MIPSLSLRKFLTILNRALTYLRLDQIEKKNRGHQVRLENIETALRKGNCSAVIINNASFTEVELSQLYSSAKEGNTQCIILNNKKLMH